MAQRKSSTYTRWTTEEDELLRQAVALHGPHKWSLIASHVPNRTPMQCSTRWLGALNPNIHKGRWTEHEDAVLKYSFLEFSGIPDGEGGFQPIPWNKIAERIPNRTGIQCQARWTEALDPSVRKGKWSEDEDVLLRAGVDKFGRCWIRIAETVPGRTQRQCRTRWMQIKYKEEKLSSGLTTTISSSNNDKKSLSSTSPKQLQQEPNGHHGGDVTATTMTTTTVSSDDAGSSGASCTSTEPDSLDFMVSDQVPISGLVAPADLFSPTQQQHTSSFDNFGLDCPSIRHPPSHHQQQQQQQHHHHHHHHHHQTNDLSAAVFAAHQQEQQHSNLDLLSDDTLLSPFFFY
ncbi:Homeodomain-like protein [Phascolomyces articulosus]|uniref:Homeodomain-like protein n=1 Tax=Phascolomyces articulosus TaxID=60185 RepID=A0AAD5PA04_9FUNG|nr:Homeodomain-like protein [Phascolomyces articulosus]